MPAIDLRLSELSQQERYKVLSSIVIPRPIALVTALMENGQVNAAPHSFFNAFSDDPPIIALGVALRPDKTLKDTARLALHNREFVVNLVDEAYATRMSDAAIDFPPDVSEVEALGLETLPSTDIKTPRLKDAPFSYECKHMVTLHFSAERAFIVGEVLRVHARDGLMDPKTLRIDLEAYRPVGRLFGDLYAHQLDTFELKRPPYADWLKSQK